MEILFVDDNLKAAERFARLVAAETGLTTHATDDPAQAIDLVRAGYVRVVVLDQRLEGLSPDKGTELFAEMARVDPRLRSIMLSGRAQGMDYQEAIRLQFNAFVDKNEIGRLSDVVREQYDSWLVAAAQEKSAKPQKFGEYRHGFSWRGPTVTFELLGFDEATESDDRVILADSWRTVAKVNAGETTTVSVKHTVEEEVVVEREELAKAATGLSLRLQVLGQLSQQIETSVKDRSSARRKVGAEVHLSKTYALEGPAKGRRVVRARDFQVAPVYQRKRAVIRVICGCCGMAPLVRIPVLSWSGRFATQQVDYYDDNTSQAFRTGLLAGNEVT